MKVFKALNSVKAVSFDLDDTLYDNHPVIQAAEDWFALYLTELYHLPQFCADYAWWAQQKKQDAAQNPDLADDVTYLRAYSLVQAFSKLGQPLAGGVDEALSLVQVFIYKRSQIKVPDSSFELLRQVRRHFPLLAISNGNADLYQLGLNSYFDLCLRPGIGRGRSKPAPDLFIAAAHHLGIEPQALLHVGDDPITDVKGAVLAGCQCAWLEGGAGGNCPGINNLQILPTVQLRHLSELLSLLSLQV